MDKVKIKFLKDVRKSIYDGKKLTGDQMEMFSFFYGSGTGTSLGMAALKNSWELTMDLMRKVTLPLKYELHQEPEFRTHPDTGQQQVQCWNTVHMTWNDDTFITTSSDHSLPKLILLALLDVLAAQEKSSDDKD